MKENQMQTLNTENKLKELTSDTKLKVNVPMHGFVKGQEVKYGRASSQEQLNLRRRHADRDGSVTIIEGKEIVTQKPKTGGSSAGKASKTQKGDS
jgi:hypothetical protein